MVSSRSLDALGSIFVSVRTVRFHSNAQRRSRSAEQRSLESRGCVQGRSCDCMNVIRSIL